MANIRKNAKTDAKRQRPRLVPIENQTASLFRRAPLPRAVKVAPRRATGFTKVVPNDASYVARTPFIVRAVVGDVNSSAVPRVAALLPPMTDSSPMFYSAYFIVAQHENEHPGRRETDGLALMQRGSQNDQLLLERLEEMRDIFVCDHARIIASTQSKPRALLLMRAIQEMEETRRLVCWFMYRRCSAKYNCLITTRFTRLAGMDLKSFFASAQDDRSSADLMNMCCNIRDHIMMLFKVFVEAHFDFTTSAGASASALLQQIGALPVRMVFLSV